MGLAAALAFWVIEAFIHAYVFELGPIGPHLFPSDRHELWMRILVCALLLAFGFYARSVVNRLRESQRERERVAHELEQTLTRMLSGFVPICASCKSVRDDGSWTPVESYITERTDTKFSHTVCPTCAERLYPEQSTR